MKDKVLGTIEKYHMIEKGDCIVAGVSGGADSIALIFFLNDISRCYNLKLTAIHVHHGIRGKEADEDATFVEKFCHALNIPCHIVHRDIKSESKMLKIGLEEAGRIARYSVFQNVLEKEGGGKIAVAHNQNDQAETLLMRLCRGTGLRGLSGIAPVRDNIIRPFLFCSRDEIENYCKEKKLSFCTDSTNLTDAYTRNKIRLHLLPWLNAELNQKATQNIAKTSMMIAEEDSFVEQLAQEVFQSILILKEENALELSLKKLKNQPIVLQRRVFRLAVKLLANNNNDISFFHIDEMIGLLDKPEGKSISLPKGLCAKRERESLCIFCSECNKQASFCYQLDMDKTIYLKELNKFVRISSNEDKNTIKSTDICTKVFDYDKIKGSVQIRTRQSGDKIIFRGIGGSKKIKEYFIDEKIPREERDKTALLADGENILWILGHRVSDWYLASQNTKNVLIIQIWEDVLL